MYGGYICAHNIVESAIEIHKFFINIDYIIYNMVYKINKHVLCTKFQ
jgi:hypothetical protein